MAPSSAGWRGLSSRTRHFYSAQNQLIHGLMIRNLAVELTVVDGGDGVVMILMIIFVINIIVVGGGGGGLSRCFGWALAVRFVECF
jgi:hypothetical protein